MTRRRSLGQLVARASVEDTQGSLLAQHESPQNPCSFGWVSLTKQRQHRVVSCAILMKYCRVTALFIAAQRTHVFGKMPLSMPKPNSFVFKFLKTKIRNL